MAKSALQRKRESLERKQVALKAMPESTRSLTNEPFVKFYKEDGNASMVELALDVMGMNPNFLRDDSSPAPFNHDTEFDFSPYTGSIGRAELCVSMWLEAAQVLAGIINNFKRNAVEMALSRLEEADLTDPLIRKKVMAENLRLHKIRERLNSTVRVAIQAYEIKGI